MTDALSREKLAEIRARHEAATPGPWAWDINVRAKRAMLTTRGRGMIYIMGFWRWGMQSAAPIFQHYKYPERRHESLGGGTMKRVDELPNLDLDHNSRPRNGIPNQDAQFIEHSWSDVDALLKERDRLAKGFCALMGCRRMDEFELGNHASECPLDTGYVPTWLRDPVTS